ncbi:uncharacterized protein DEA37_0007578 [Paragonimus westermani]|uniref:Glutathione peroxidase n=1 Tax=Paragonimus westermani TaxID=34504 RepID=A0A5J4NMU5_9TREM|nr:uncharacterized protein DEA37_0007578 [Paragonimus westermani]
MQKFSMSFDLFEKINVNGEDAHPLYKFLQNAVPGTLVNAIKWNYTKFLTDRNGIPLKRYAPTTAPMRSSSVFNHTSTHCVELASLRFE